MKLFIGAHTDDIEAFAGGLLLQTKEDKHCIIFSPCGKSIPKGFCKNATVKELKCAMEYANTSYTLYDFPVREFPQYRQDILELLIKAKKQYKPDTVYCINDSHQDHQTIGEECNRAFRNCSLINFGNNLNGFVNYNYIVSLTEEEVKRKVEMISFYKSQLSKGQFKEIDLINKMKYHGSLVGLEYAELYNIIRLIQR